MKYTPIVEWTPHTFTNLLLPIPDGDWGCCYWEVLESYRELIRKIAQFEPVVVGYQQEIPKTIRREEGRGRFPILFRECRYNDTWVRDSGGIPVRRGNQIGYVDFKFNGWGLKYPANWDNRLTRTLFPDQIFESFNFVLEGGAVEFGEGYLLTTSNCLLEENRNYPLTKEEIGDFLEELFSVKLLWVTGLPLVGDDTDGHIDTMARFLPGGKILYLKGEKGSPNYPQLELLEEELKELGARFNFQLIPIPEPAPIWWEGRQLPATYLNFHWVNGGVLIPTYNSQADKEVLKLFQKLLPDRQILPVESTIFIRQNGSIHCLTRDYYHPF
ncbi:MAG: agmatine deiminase family protein [Campylobacterales bacterium]